MSKRKGNGPSCPRPLHPAPSLPAGPRLGAPGSLNPTSPERNHVGSPRRARVRPQFSKTTQSPKQSPPEQISGRAGEVCGCSIRKTGGASHCGLRTKGFQRCSVPRCPSRFGSLPADPGHFGAFPGKPTRRSLYTRGSCAASGSRGCAPTSHSHGHPHAAPFPQCSSPRSRAPARPWR